MLARAATVLALLAILLPLSAAQTGGSVQTLPARLPDPVEGPAAAMVGKFVYLFGGVIDGSRMTDKIVRFDPDTRSTSVMNAKVTPARHGATAAAANGVIYLFGGHGCYEGGAHCATIAKYDPATDRYTNTTASFGRGYYYMAAATVGDAIYIAGGESTLSRLREIWKFDVANETLTMTQADLPMGLSQMGATTIGNKVYLFGGCDPDGKCQRDFIFAYDPVANKLTQVPATLPQESYGMSAVTDGKVAYLLGGQDYPHELDTIVRFDPATNAVSLLQAKLPSPRFRTAAAWAEGAAFLFGGEVEDHEHPENSERLSEIVRFEPAQGTVEPTEPVPPKDDGNGIPAPGLPLAIVALAGFVLLLRRRA